MGKQNSGGRKRQQAVRAPATKFPHLQKRMRKRADAAPRKNTGPAK